MSEPQKLRKRKSSRVRFTPELADAVCTRISEGFSLRQALRENGDAPIGTWFEWMRTRAELCEQYARAREAQGEILADELHDLARSVTPENANAVRVAADIKKWTAARLAPKRYGDRLGVEHAGKDGGPLTVQVEMIGGKEE